MASTSESHAELDGLFVLVHVEIIHFFLPDAPKSASNMRMTPTIVPNLHQSSNWTRQSGTGIGPNVPSSYGFLQPSPSGGMLFYVEGVKGQYCDWLSAQHIPLPSNLAPVYTATLDLIVVFDSTIATDAQGFEFDILNCKNGYNFLAASQILLNQGNELQISPNTAGWNPGFSGPSTITPEEPHHFTVSAQFDTGSNSFIRGPIIIDNQIFDPPASQSSLTAIKTGWADYLIIQLQQDTTNEGTGWTFDLLNAWVTFS